MTSTEATAILDSIASKEKLSWEQFRWISYIQALSQGAKLKSPVDLIKFGWEYTEAEIAEAADTRTKEEIITSLLELKKLVHNN